MCLLGIGLLEVLQNCCPESLSFNMGIVHIRLSVFSDMFVHTRSKGLFLQLLCNSGGLEQEGLFQVNGNAETVEWLRQRYDNGEDVDLVKEADVPSAISLLRFFLQELPEPVIPGSLHIHLMQLSQGNNYSVFLFY